MYTSCSSSIECLEGKASATPKELKDLFDVPGIRDELLQHLGPKDLYALRKVSHTHNVATHCPNSKWTTQPSYLVRHNTSEAKDSHIKKIQQLDDGSLLVNPYDELLFEPFSRQTYDSQKLSIWGSDGTNIFSAATQREAKNKQEEIDSKKKSKPEKSIEFMTGDAIYQIIQTGGAYFVINKKIGDQSCLSKYHVATGRIYNIRTLDDNKFITCNQNGTLSIFNLEGVLLRQLVGHSLAVMKAETLSSGKIISASMDRTLKVWDPISGQNQLTLSGHEGAVTNVMQLADGRVASASTDNTIKIWNLEKGTCEYTLKGHTSALFGMKELVDGRLISWDAYSGMGPVGNEYTIRVWDLKKLKLNPVPTNILPKDPYCGVFSMENGYLAYVNSDGKSLCFAKPFFKFNPDGTEQSLEFSGKQYVQNKVFKK